MARADAGLRSLPGQSDAESGSLRWRRRVRVQFACGVFCQELRDKALGNPEIGRSQILQCGGKVYQLKDGAGPEYAESSRTPDTAPSRLAAARRVVDQQQRRSFLLCE